jgi:hypothetical protein
LAAAEPEIKSLEGQPGYKQLQLKEGSFEGQPAVRWKFLVLESGVLLEKEDLFISDSAASLGFGILTEAPASEYSAMAREFAKLRRTIVIK